MSISSIELRNIGKYYYSENAVTQALRKVNLSFQKNEFVAITGESGSGKSTLLKLISGMDNYDDGEMFLDGESTSQYDDDDWEQYRRQEIGYVFQDYSLIGHYSARDNIVSALLIMGMELEEAREKAVQYLERVGLREQEKQMASKLSSGQKQRLSIARALAKGTDIIVADEPTGNLDSETGEQIVRLLADLSKDHLVIMVTHNYEQVAPYVSRKVFLHDGEVASDTPVNQGPAEDSHPEADSRNQTASEDSHSHPQKAKQDIKRVALLFAKWNIRTQAGKVILFTAFFLVTALVSFLFIGELLMNADDRLSKTYDPSAYANETKTRIVVRHKDNTPITDKDVETLRKLDYVTLVDEYDCINDINYYYRSNKDYMYFFGYSDEEYGGGGTSVEFLDHRNFMHSSTCITKEDLAAGKMPEELGEIVMYSKDGEAALGQELKIYLRDKNAWGSDNYICRSFKVVGLLKDKTEQIYFSPKYCLMLTVGMSIPVYKLYFYFDREQNTWFGRDSLIPMADESLDHDEIYGDLAMQISKHYQMPADRFNRLPPEKEVAFGGEKDYLEIYHYDREGNLEEELETLSAEGISNENYHESSTVFLAISEAAFEAHNDMNNYQASVYFNSYAKTDHVLKAIEKAGFDAISTFQASVTEYDEEKVTERLTIIGIACVVLLMLFISEALILRSLMKIQIKDFFVMKFMGMRMGLMKRISYYEMGIYLIFALCISIVFMHIGRLKFSLLHEMLYYYEWPGYLLFVAYNLLTGFITVVFFNRLLRGRMDQ